MSSKVQQNQTINYEKKKKERIGLKVYPSSLK